MNNSFDTSQYISALTERAKRFAKRESEPMLNCSHCMDLGYIQDMSTDGVSVLCKECSKDLIILGTSLVRMKEEYLCEICRSLLMGDKADAANWDGVRRSLICDDCVVKYTKEASKEAIDDLKNIIGDE